MSLGAAIGGLGAIGGAFISADAASYAADVQRDIAAQNIAFQKDMYNQNVKRLDPWVQYGTTQMNALAAMMPSLTAKYDYAQYQAGPEYQNMMAQTDRERNALMAKSAASGMYGSGTMANQLQSNAAYLGQQGYQQGLSNYWAQNNNIYNMLNQGSQVGESAAAQQAAQGSQLASNVGNINQNLGNALANSATQQGQAWAGAIGSLGNLAMNYDAQANQYTQQQNLLNSALKAQGYSTMPVQDNSIYGTVKSWFN